MRFSTRRVLTVSGVTLAIATLAAIIAMDRPAPATPPPATGPPADSIEATHAQAIDSLEALGHWKGAIELARAGVERLQRRGIRGAPLATALMRVGTLETGQGSFAEGVRMLTLALAESERDGTTGGAPHASILVALARAEKNQGLYAASETHFKAALAIPATDVEGVLVRANALAGMAHLIRRRAEDLPRAAGLLEEALGIALRAGEPGASHVPGFRSGLALVLLQLQRPAEAETQLQEAMPYIIAQRGADHPEVGLTYSLWGWSQYLQGHFKDSELSFRHAMATYDRASRHIEEGSSRRRVLPRVAVNLAAALLEQGRGEEAWQALETGLSSYLVERLNGTESAEKRPGADRTALQSVLDDRSAMVGWMEVSLVAEPPRSIWGFVIRKTGPVHWVRLQPAEAFWGSATWELLVPIQRDSWWPARVVDYSEAEARGRDAWNERVEPLLPYLAGVEHLVAVNALSRAAVPIESFVDPAGRCLIERFVVSYAPSAGAYSALCRRSRNSWPATTPSALLVDDTPDRAAKVFGRSLPKLPGTRSEIETIHAVLPRATVLESRSMQRSQLNSLVESGAIGRFDLMHFATHATNDARVPGSAALIISASDARPGARAPHGGPVENATDHELLSEDGLLTASEIERWQLNARLVALSGCRTLGGTRFGTAHGLAESFLVAGAAGVLASLWSVDDRAAALLLGRFYEVLLPMGGAVSPPDIPEALREAKLWLRDLEDDSGRRLYRNPAYWSGFIYIGGDREKVNPPVALGGPGTP